MVRGENSATDGKKANVNLGIAGTLVSTGELVPGNLYSIASLATESSAIATAVQDAETEKAYEVGDFFVCPSTGITLAVGDSVYPIVEKFMGFANGKSLSKSKDTIDVTCDKDETIKSFISAGLVGVTGTINGFDLVQLGKDSAINILRREFGDVFLESEANAGKMIKLPKTDNTYLLIFRWRDKGLKAGDVYDMDVLPAIFNSLENSAEYGSGKAFNIGFTGCDQDSLGRQAAYLAMKYFTVA